MAVAPLVAYWLVGAEYLFTWFAIDFMIGVRLQGRSSNKLGTRRALTLQPEATAVARLEALANAVARRMNVARPDVVLPLDSALGWENALATRSAKRGRMVLVSRRMLDEAPPEAVAAVIAHELGHLRPLDLRCMRAAAYLRLFLPLALAVATIVAPATSPDVLLAYVYVRVAIDLITRAVSRLGERRADSFAMSGGFGPDLARLIEWQMARRPGGWRMPPRLLSSHLKNAPRVARLSSSTRGDTQTDYALLLSGLADAKMESQLTLGSSPRSAGAIGPASPAAACQHCGYARTPVGKTNCYNCGRPLVWVIEGQPAAE
jgi:Zn-dependent protease with chaperone function